jgi:hypothetical protein
VSAILAGVFVGVVLAVQAVLGPVTGSSTIAVAGSTLLAAALFQPLRRRVQRLVDRRFNRSRYDAEQTVAAFAARLRDEVDLEQLRAEPDHARRGHPGAGKRIPVAAGTGG